MMRRSILSMAAGICLLVGGNLRAADYFADPVNGSAEGDGSKAKPWKTLEEVIANGALKKLKGGDSLLLNTGFHGAATFSGENEKTITIAAAEGQKPTLSRLTIPSGKNWLVRGLIISPSFASEPYKGTIVTFGEQGESSKITIEDCYVFTVEDASEWDAQQWMETNGGILMGRAGKDLTLRNNYVRNTRFGISLTSFDSLCEGNIVSDFSADAIRATRDGQIVQYNIIKNIYVSAADGDNNHDDGIQCFLFNKGKGEVKNVKIIGNIILSNNDDADRKWQATLQGIGFFDGPLVDFVVTDNVVNVNSYHGISLYDAQNALVERNIVTSPEEAKIKSWMMFGTKIKQSKDNVAKNNYALTFKLKQPGTVEEKNEKVTPEIYQEGLKRAYKTIVDKYGAKHVAADREKLQIK